MSRGRAKAGTLPTLRQRPPVRKLLILFGDQLDIRNPAIARLDPVRDAVLMMEVADEVTHVASHTQRTTLFLAAMRHFALELCERGLRVHYVTLDAADNGQSFDAEVRRAAQALEPQRISIIHPGEWRVMQMVEGWRSALGVPLEVQADTHFYLTPAEFAAWAMGRRGLVLEHFYRMMRRKLGILVDAEGEPEGGAWNFDHDNRRPFKGPGGPPRPKRFNPDAITREVMALVERRFPDAPGRLDRFAWPITRRDALAALRDFIRYRLPDFGAYQDAMVTGEPWMFHSLLSPAMNLKRLDPREIVAAALEAYAAGAAPLNSVEGFIRQIIGWREFIRGVYWLEGPDYADRNALDQHGRLPEFYWTGATDMACLRASIGEVLENGFGHHIQRLMVTGNFALIAGVHPRAVSDWYLGMYVDAVDWVTLPNTLGMAMHADGGVVGTKPYAASGRYIDRMSDYCTGCRYAPGERTGEGACPFTTFYWDFLLRAAPQLRGNPRMTMILKNLDRMTEREMSAIRALADARRVAFGIGPVRSDSL